MDKKAIIKKLLLDPVDWITLGPLVAGVTLGLGSWAIDLRSGMMVASSVILMLISAGIYLHRLVFNWDENYERTIREWRASVEKRRDAELDGLYRDLQEDGDPRTEVLLKDLRTLTKLLMSEQSDSLAVTAFDIVSDVDKLFHSSVGYLRESLDLWNTARAMERESIKASLLEHRESLIVEVEKSLENLGEVLGCMKKSAVSSREGQDLDELREELTARLRMAEEVEDRMKAMRRGRAPVDDEEKYLQYADK